MAKTKKNREEHRDEPHWATEAAYKNGYAKGRADAADQNRRLRNAIALLEKEYEKALKNDFVRDPVAYALYQTWKEVDEQS